MRKTTCGLADLARAFHALRPSHTECAAIARLLGLQGNIVFESQASEQHRVRIPEDGFSIPPRTLAEDDEDEIPAERIWHYRRLRRWEHEPRVEPPSFDEISRPVRLTVLKPPPVGEMPSYVAEAEELDFRRGTHRNLYPPHPLVPRNQLRSLISDLITTAIPGEPDIGRIVMALARGHLPRPLPRISRRGFARRVHVIWDTADPMWLFRRDAAAILDGLDVLAGNAVQRESISHGPPAIRPLAKAAHGDTVVIFSGLGIGGGSRTDSQTQARWSRFGGLQRRLGLRLAALVPSHPTRWPNRVKRNFRMVHWHRPGVVAAQAKQSDLHYLARVLSLAAVIDPALLRYVRMKMLPASDGGMEADFLNSPWVVSFNPRVILMNPRWTVALRAELAENPPVMEAVRHLLATQRPKEDSWERVVCEEGLIYLSLQKDTSSQEGLQRALARVIRSLLGRMRDAASARWALYLFQELPEVAQRTEAAQLLKAVASVILNTSHNEVADIVAIHNAKWIYGESTHIGVRWTGECIILCEPPRIGDHILEIPATKPRVVIVATPDEGRKRVLRISRWKYGWTRATTLPRILKTTAGAEYRLDAFDDTAAWERLQKAYDEKQTVVGEIRGQPVRGFYWIDIGVPALLSRHELIAESFDAFQEVIAAPLEVRIVSIDRERRRVVVTPRDAPPSELWAQFRQKFKAGTTITGTVKHVTADYCLVDIGATAFVPLIELEAEEARQPHNLIGKTLEFSITRLSSVKKARIFLSRRLDEQRIWRKVEDASKAYSPVTGRVTDATAAGFNVNIGISAFLPNEEVGDADPESAQLLGKTLEFAIKSCDRVKRMVTLSIKDAQKLKQRQKLFEELQPGDTRKGVVKNITDFGAFIDLGGIDGLLHLTEMSWGRISHPSELVRVGQELITIVLEINREKRRVSLGLRQLNPSPWNGVEAKYPVGTRVQGKVTNLVPYGAFVELEPGVQGLVHITEFSWDRTPHKPADILKEGEEIETLILGVNKEERKLSLSIRQLTKGPWDTADQRYPIGTCVRGRVSNVKTYGAFVELEPAIDGMIHISNMSAAREITDASEVLKKGDMVETVVISVDKDQQQIALALKSIEKV
jgi:small subunit ribosomal protein S1